MENKIKVELLNVMKYNTKEDNKPRSMINYRLLDNAARQLKSEKFKGFAVLNAYYDGHDVYDKIPAEWTGCAVDIVIKKETSVYDPTKEVSKIVKINDIDLV